MSGAKASPKRPKYVALDGDVLMFRVSEGDQLVDRVYIRDPSSREDWNCWIQMPNVREYAKAHDPEMYERNWGRSPEEKFS